MKKKTFKRAGAAVLSMAMLLSFGAISATTASAAKTNNTVAVSAPAIDASIGQTSISYDVYKVLDATANGENYNYVVSTKFNGKTSVAAIQAKSDASAAEKQEFAQALVGIVNDNSIAKDYTISSSDRAPTDLAPGYYLAIATTVGNGMNAAPVLFSIGNDDTTTDDDIFKLTSKTSGVTFHKHITDVKGDGSYSSNSNRTGEGKVGCVHEYTITSTIPSYSEKVKAKVNAGELDITDYEITDNPSHGITIYDGDNKATINGEEDSTPHASTIVVSTTGTAFNETTPEYTITTTNGDGGFTVTLTDAYVVNNPNATITITFDAVINDSALISTTASTQANPNDATLTYDNNYVDGGGSDTKTEKTKVYTTKLDLVKQFNGSSETKIAGATFELYKGSFPGDTTPTGTPIDTFTTSTTTTSKTFTGLAAGTYTLVETHVPDGYQKAANQVVEINAETDNGLTDATVYTVTGATTTNTVTVNNIQGQNLPGTGGMGTILFTVGGAAIVLLAGTMFVIYMKKRKVEE